MQRVHSARGPFLTAFWHLLTVVVGVGQLLVVSAAWLDRVPDATGARPHAEAGGTRLHHGHSSSECGLCAVQHVGGVPAVSRALPVVAPPTIAPCCALEAALVQANCVAANRTRAPPTEL